MYYNLLYNLPMKLSLNPLKPNTEPVTFHLNEETLLKWRGVQPNFGFNGLGEITYLRSYSRLKKDGSKETWFDTVKRVVEGTYAIQKAHVTQNGMKWIEQKAQESASKMFEYIFTFKFTPPGRGLWAMGTDIINKKGLFEALNNCAFVSTQYMNVDPIKPFTFMMDASMLGIGVGFDVLGAGMTKIHLPLYPEIILEIPDSREGWVMALSQLLASYFYPHCHKVAFDYSELRPAGAPLKTFGGYSSGYKPLKDCLDTINDILFNRAHTGKKLTETDITDIMNLIGKCVVSGGIRRTAQIAFGDGDEFINLKNYDKNSYRSGWGWASNNSIMVDGFKNDYTEYIDSIIRNGEPGFLFLHNAQEFGRMGTYSHDDRNDWEAKGANPCNEQTLEHMEMCCLVETYPANCKDLEEYLDVLKYAYLYAKTITLGKTNWTETNAVMLRNRRIGTSMSGLAQFIEKRGIPELTHWMSRGYVELERWDEIYSDWYAVPKSIKLTSIKPSGTVSLLAGATPGIHYPESRYYIRRIRISATDPLVSYLKERGTPIEPQLIKIDGEWVEDETTFVASFYVDSNRGW
jgi:ribonucleotide reductase alpha subunit